MIVSTESGGLGNRIKSWVSAMRLVVTGCVMRNSGTWLWPARRPSFSKKLGIPAGSKPAWYSVPMPMRSASASCVRVKSIWFCTLMPCAMAASRTYRLTIRSTLRVVRRAPRRFRNKGARGRR